MNNYDVFISSSSNDFSIAGKVYTFLQRHNLNVFFSDQSLPQLGSSDYRKVIDKAIEHTKHMVVVTSSRANVEGEWVEAEWGSFINEKRSGRKNGNLITILVGQLTHSDLPMSLRQYEILPFTPEGLSKLLSYLKPAQENPSAFSSPVAPRKSTSFPQKNTTRSIMIGMAAVFTLALFTFAGSYFFRTPKQGLSLQPESSLKEMHPTQTQTPLTQEAARSHRATTEQRITQNQSPQKREESKQDSNQTEPALKPQPAQKSVTVPQAAESLEGQEIAFSPLPSQSGPSPPTVPAKEGAFGSDGKSQLSSAPQSRKPELNNLSKRINTAAAAKPVATVYIPLPSANDLFVNRLVNDIHFGLAKSNQRAATPSAAQYVFRWQEEPRIERRGPDSYGEYTFSITFVGEVYNPAGSRVVKQIPFREDKTGRNDEAARILDTLIHSASSKILQVMATLEE
ncbi:TIR domain-containing protein [Desulfobulbus sp.]|uniref:TIR domain-containing protein n=1 Tax=Desulfobulbus sp. TaxID=895 RepID=UPI00286F89E1|nr:TIR domain-containing protein [Desulfobulbus sp.]